MPADAPSPPALLQALDATGAAIHAALEQASEAQLSAPSPVQLPAVEPTVRGAVAFFGYHEGYHVGQMGYLRKWLGHPSLVG